METDDETTPEQEAARDVDWLAEQVRLITLEDGFDS
jgi:hypothetical protein